MSTQRLALGIDGGGTKTVAWIAPLEQTDMVLGRGHAGPSNPRAAGFDAAEQNIAAAIDAAFADAGICRTTVAAACFGLAGAGRTAEQERLTAWALDRGISQSVRVCGDAELVLAAAEPEDVGIALICGTGSLAWGRNREGKIARCGGWGYLLGDEGSAYHIATEALRAALRFADGRAPETELLDAFMKELDAPSPDDLMARVYAPDMTHQRLAQLATLVFDRWSTDRTAGQVVAAAAAALAKMVATVSARLAFPQNDYTLAMAGSVLLHQPRYVEQIISALLYETRHRRYPPGRWLLVEQPVRGAIALARQLATG